MASPGQLVQVMADVLGLSKATVTQYDRVLAENGLRTRRGRGRSAAKVSSRDAACLLIALAASPIANEAPSICKHFCSLKWFQQEDDPRSSFSKLGVTALGVLPDEHCFGTALSALIEAAGRDELARLLAEGAIFVHFNLGPPSSAHIVAKRSLKSRSVVRLVYFDVSGDASPEADLSRISMIGTPTIKALGQLVHHG